MLRYHTLLWSFPLLFCLSFLAFLPLFRSLIRVSYWADSRGHWRMLTSPKRSSPQGSEQSLGDQRGEDMELWEKESPHFPKANNGLTSQKDDRAQRAATWLDGAEVRKAVFNLKQNRESKEILYFLSFGFVFSRSGLVSSAWPLVTLLW